MVMNSDIAGVLEAIADPFACDDACSVPVRARRNVARTLGFSCRQMVNLVECGRDLPALPVLGDDLPALIEQALCAGRMHTLGALPVLAPIAPLDLLDVEGTGLKRAFVFRWVPGIPTPERLFGAVLGRRVRAVAGFTEKTEAWRVEVFEKVTSPRSARWPILWGLAQAGRLRRHIAATPAISRAEVVRSLQRGGVKVADPGAVIETKDTKGALDRFLDGSHLKRIAATGDTKATAILEADCRSACAARSPEAGGAYGNASPERNPSPLPCISRQSAWA